MIQTCLWDPIKEYVPAFVQGMTKDQMKASFTDKVGSGWKSICLDGSGFDSTQNNLVMDAIDNKFFKSLKPGLLHLLKTFEEKCPTVFRTDTEKLVDMMIASAI